ncbi:MAG TPA: hypothetical protein PLF78_01895 [Caulobacter sp.]|nr:hypothetical protein [Caulobacter sp.]
MAVFFSRFPRAAREGHEVLEATEARQGRWGRHVFWVLVASTVLAAVALFSSWGFHADELTAANTASTPTAAEAAATTGPESPVKQ